MKNMFFFLSALIIISCQRKQNNTSTVKGDSIVPSSPAQTVKGNDDQDQVKEKLSSLEPASADQLKSFFPENLGGGVRGDVDANESLGTGAATARYVINDSANIELSIIDAGGPGGVGIYSQQYENYLGLNSDDANETMRTITWKGHKAIERSSLANHERSLTWLAAGRYLVVLAGHYMSKNDVENAAAALSIH